eukprot:TRINITY_DN1346_c0_g1_i6.p1 TRINITY_DN1346_c0_g1~~TRINITY_DN1346_c0_g1_i6.p1  ORF type:complete len:725 (+),score=230.06 TRINITY_DN1346_c0_g1_i6:884-3058(+)
MDPLLAGNPLDDVSKLNNKDKPSLLRGIAARRDLMPNQPIVRVPDNLWLCKTTAVHSPIGYVFQAFPDLDQRAVLEIFLLHERSSEKSLWTPYLNMLPKTVDSLINWEPEAIVELQGSPMIARRQYRINSIIDRYRTVIEPVIKNFPDLFPIESKDMTADYVWIFSIVMSRSVSITVDSEPLSVLIPLVDMFNHAPCTSYNNLSSDGGTFILSTGRQMNYKEGDQVFMDIGLSLSNADFIDRYGFAIPMNVRDFVEFSFKVQDVAHPSLITELKTNLMLKAMLVAEDGNSQVHTLSGYFLPRQLVISLRLLLIVPKEMGRMDRALAGQPVSWRNEVAVANCLFKKCTELLEAYPTSLKEDRSRLKKALPANVRYAIIYRIEQKRILLNTLRVLRHLQLLIEEKMKGDNLDWDHLPEVDLLTLQYDLGNQDNNQGSSSSSSSSSTAKTKGTTGIHFMFDRQHDLVDRLPHGKQRVVDAFKTVMEQHKATSEPSEGPTVEEVCKDTERMINKSWESQLGGLVLLCAQHDLHQALSVLLEQCEAHKNLQSSVKDIMNNHDGKGRSAAFMASSRNSLESLRILISHGADVNNKDTDDLSCVHIACVKGNVEVLKYLLNDVIEESERRDWVHGKSRSEGYTPLHFAVMNDHVQVAKVLLEEFGANVNEPADDHITALHACSFSGGKKMCELLLKHGADTSIETDQLHMTALQTADMSGNTEVADVLERE